MKTRSVCLRCGDFKDHPQNQCGQCGFVPTSNREKAESIVLSEGYQADDEYVTRTTSELRAFSEDIKNGRPITFDAAEIERIIKLGEEVDNIPRVGWKRALLQMLLPIAIVIIGVYFAFFR